MRGDNERSGCGCTEYATPLNTKVLESLFIQKDVASFVTNFASRRKNAKYLSFPR